MYHRSHANHPGVSASRGLWIQEGHVSGRGVCIWEVCIQGGSASGESASEGSASRGVGPTPPAKLGKLAVRILLECILVHIRN